MDDYAVGFKKYVDISIDDILLTKLIGLVNCDNEPLKYLYVTALALPVNANGKLPFHLHPMKGKPGHLWS